MSKCKSQKIDSSVVGLAIAEEVCVAELPSGEIGITSQSAFTADIAGNISLIALDYNQCEKDLTVTITTATASGGLMLLRVNRDRAAVITNNVGVLDFAGGDDRWETNPDSTAIARWDALETRDSTSKLVAIISLDGEIENGDVFTVQVTEDDFTTNANIDLTVTIDGTGEVIWRQQEVAEYGDFGPELTLSDNKRISKSRQATKGSVIDLEANSSYTTELYSDTFERLIRGLLCAEAHQRPSTEGLVVADSLTVIAIADDEVTVGAGQGAEFKVGDIIAFDKLPIAANNLKPMTVTSIAGDVLSFAADTIAADVFGTNSRMDVVGFENIDADIDIQVTGAVVTLVSATFDFTTLGLNVGEWVFIGGDAEANRFAQGSGYARVRKVGPNSVTIDRVGWARVQTESPATAIQIFLPTYTRNEAEPELIVAKSFQFERTLGSDQIGPQSEYMLGQFANELTLDFPSKEKMTAEFSFIGTDAEYRDGAQGLKPGTRVTPPLEEGLNSASHVYEIAIYVHDDTQLGAKSLFGSVEEGNLQINNNITANSRIGKLGPFDVTLGTLEATGELTAYFLNIQSQIAIRENADIGWNKIVANGNKGFVFDMPLLALSGGQVEIEEGEPIKIPVEMSGAENVDGYTLSYSHFNYLPKAAMATGK